jgi:S-adenosylmethionine synthetase
MGAAMPAFRLTSLDGMPVADAPVEIVERKGLGHPDTLCDALAEALSQALCGYYLDHFGLILHHNVDKALLWGGAAEPAFNGGRVTAPMEIFLAGRATREFRSMQVPVEELAQQTCRSWLRAHMHALDIERDVRIHTMIRPGSHDLVELYLRQQHSGIALANDTSCGVGYAPLDELERLVLAVENRLNDAGTRATSPEIGEDIKLMALRRDAAVMLTVSCAFVDRFVTDFDDYLAKKARLAARVHEIATQHTTLPVSVDVNAADGTTPDSLFLTVTGTSAEAGDDGEVGRGNRSNGLITPYRPMNMEAVAGKNPVTHVGKLYNIIAGRVAGSIVERLPVTEAYCYLISRIGHPVCEPQVVEVRVRTDDIRMLAELDAPIRAIVEQELHSVAAIQHELMSGRMRLY